MPAPQLTDGDFIELFRGVGPYQMQQQTGLGLAGIFQRRARLEKKYATPINGPKAPQVVRTYSLHPGRIEAKVDNGKVLIGSDGHYWPGPATTAHRAFVKFCKELRPSIVIMNGDALDGASISRHDSIGWETRPSLIEEIEACKERLHEIVMAKPPKSRCIWPLGNHDGRFESRLARVAPEYANVHGVHLKDHFDSAWEPCWSVWINDTVVVKHRNKGGIHGGHNNTLWAGKTTVTGHTHQLKVSPLPDYNGVRWGVECGALSEPYGAQFADYTEDNPRLWQSGFVVLTFVKGKLLQPELVRVHDETHVDFRGELVKV
jgi:hypothetical protein